MQPEEASQSNAPAQVDWLSLPSHLLVYIISLVRYEHRPSLLLSCRTLYHLANPWRVKELRTRPEPIQSPEISIKMREILIEWLVEVQQEYKLHRNTLFLAVSYIDRVLGAAPLPKQELQLLGATCMWIAAKFEELTSPLLRDFEYICDATYKTRQVRSKCMQYR